MPIVGSKTPISDLEIAQAIVAAGITQSKRVPQGNPASGIRVVADFVAIALAESSGIPGNYNTVGAGHYGLWQISALHFPGRDASKVQWMQPSVNAQYAVKVFNEQGYGAWTTYPLASNAYLNRGKIAAEQALGAKYPDIIPENPLDPLKQAYAALQKFGAFISDENNWIRVGLFIAGFAIIIVGVIRMSAPVAATVAKNIPVGKVVKAVK